MKTIILSAVVICLMTGAQSAFALDLSNATFSKHPMVDIISGLALGAQDAKDSCVHPDGCHWWILMRGHGFINQTQEFIKGYVHGFWSTPENALGGGSDAEQADIRCDKGPEGAAWASPGSLDDNNTTYWTPN
jgi:hypothetical protein